MDVLEAARSVKEQTSNINGEFKRAVANGLPRQLGEPRILSK